MLKDLIKLAEGLDGIGLYKESDSISDLIKIAASNYAHVPVTPEVGFYQCNHSTNPEHIYFDGKQAYNILMPGAWVPMKLRIATLEGLRVHTNGAKEGELKNKVDSHDKKLTDAEFGAAVRLKAGWYKVPEGQNANNYWYVGQDYSILQVARDGTTSSVSMINFFRMLEAKGVPVKPEEYAASVNKANYDKRQKAVEEEEGSVIGDTIVRSKRGKNLEDRGYTYTTSEDGLSFSWRHKRSGKTGTFSQQTNPDKWFEAVSNLNESRTTEITPATK
jgi:hypothetical protein